MHRCIFIVFCVLGIAACSPKHYIGEQTAQSSQQSATADSVSVSRSLRETVAQSVNEGSETLVVTETETVVEILSEPDSTGVQHVKQRETTRQKTQSKTSVGRISETDSQRQETVDSLQVSEASQKSSSELTNAVELKTRRPVPGWIYVVGLAAALFAACYLFKRIRL